MKKNNVKQNELDFVSIASHQLRTPLTLMKGYLSMILGGDFGTIKEARLKTALTAVYQANERLIRLVENLLNMTTLENGRLRLHQEPTDILAMLRTIIKEMRPKARSKNLSLKISSFPEKIFINIDPILMRQVMLNLVDNAIKYTAAGSVTIALKKLPGKLSLSVSDTGPGVEPKALKNIFDKFERRDVSNSSEEGFGLGLYVCKLIVEAHGGTIGAESRGRGFGFKVSVMLPSA